MEALWKAEYVGTNCASFDARQHLVRSPGLDWGASKSFLIQKGDICVWDASLLADRLPQSFAPIWNFLLWVG